MRCFKMFITLMKISFLVIPAVSSGFVYAGQIPMVFIVHSYEKGHVCGWPQAEGVVNALIETGLYPDKVGVEEFFMNTKKIHTTPEAMAERGRLALEVINRLKPDVVVVLDDNAFREVGLKLVDRPGIGVVFCGLNGFPDDYDKECEFMDSWKHPGHNVTGMYEQLHLKRSLTVIKNTLPNVKKVVGITDYSPTGKALLKQFDFEAAEGLPVEWEVRLVSTFKEYKALIGQINQDETIHAIYPVALTLPTEDGSRATAPEIYRWTVANNKKPEIALNYFFCKMGLFGGATVDFRVMGRLAGLQAVAILNGTYPGDLEIVAAPDYAIVFNLERAKELGITIPEDILLAADSVFMHMEIKDSPGL